MQRIPLQPQQIDYNIINRSPKRSSPTKHASPTKRRVGLKKEESFTIYADPPGTKQPAISVLNEEDKENAKVVASGKENSKPGRKPLADVNISACKGWVDGVPLNVPWAVGSVPSYATPQRHRILYLEEKKRQRRSADNHPSSLLRKLKNELDGRHHLEKQWGKDRQWFEEADADDVVIRPFHVRAD